MVGDALGDLLGDLLGLLEGARVVGDALGDLLGLFVGLEVGETIGRSVIGAGVFSPISGDGAVVGLIEGSFWIGMPKSKFSQTHFFVEKSFRVSNPS